MIKIHERKLKDNAMSNNLTSISLREQRTLRDYSPIFCFPRNKKIPISKDKAQQIWAQIYYINIKIIYM